MAITRISKKTGELFIPHRFKDEMFRVSDPDSGRTRHHSKNQIPVATEAELADYIRRGFAVRMRGTKSQQVNLVKADEISLSGSNISVPVTSDVPKALEEQTTTPENPNTYSTQEPTLAAYSKVGKGLLPKHGRIACNRCFAGQNVVWGSTTVESGRWCLSNNPMAWGSQTPKILVLGFSKGGNQNKDISTRPHNDVAYTGGRKNLSLILETLGLKENTQSIDDLISDERGKFAFGSLVRCSVKKYSGGKWLMSGGEIMASYLRDHENESALKNCITEHLSDLPRSLRLVIMLGNQDNYIEGCFQAISQVRKGLRRVNEVHIRTVT